MRTEILVVLVFIAVIFGYVYEDTKRKSQQSQVQHIIDGEHRLRKMSERTSSRLSSNFFLFAGDVTQATAIEVKFAWELKDGSYAISSLPIEKIRVRFDEKATTPTIRFEWRSHPLLDNADELQRLIDNVVRWATVTTKESDWPSKVELPLTTR